MHRRSRREVHVDRHVAIYHICNTYICLCSTIKLTCLQLQCTCQPPSKAQYIHCTCNTLALPFLCGASIIFFFMTKPSLNTGALPGSTAYSDDIHVVHIHTPTTYVYVRGTCTCNREVNAECVRYYSSHRQR